MSGGGFAFRLMDRAVRSYQVVGVNVRGDRVAGIARLVPELRVHQPVGVLGVRDLVN